MREYQKSIVVACFACAILLAGGCATIEGAGKDIESFGEVIQDTARDADN